MDFKIYVILFAFLGRGKLSHGIKFSAESYAEISLLAKEGKSHLESLREKSDVPQFGPCWKNAISDLQIGCKFLSENVQSDLALRFTDCFLRMSGHEPLICDLPKSACLKKLSDRAFNAYTEFYTHTQSICYFLQSQIWHEETEKTIDKLSLTSLKVSKKLEEASEIQQTLLNQQKESLSLQHDLTNSSKDVASMLHLSQEKINTIMKDFQTNAAEQKELLVELFENLMLFRTWAVKELSWFNSTLYFFAATICTFLFTSTSRTREARIILFIIFAINYLFERLLTSFLSDSLFGSYFTSSPEILNSYIWLGRKFCIGLGVIALVYTAFNYYDYNLCNYQLLLEIKNQNYKILNHISMQDKNAFNNIRNNSSEIKTFNRSSASPKDWSSDLAKLNTSYKNIYCRLHTSLTDAVHVNNPAVKDQYFFTKDVVDYNDNKAVDTKSTSEKEESSSEMNYSYNLRSCKSRANIKSNVDLV